MSSSITDLVSAVYPALARGDRAALVDLLADDFEGTVTAGLPGGCGGVHRGREAMIEEVWWALGRLFRIRVEPEQWMVCPDGRLLVVGRYVGCGRVSGAPLDAAFVHLWSAESGRLATIWQLTDSVRFVEALGPGAGGCPPDSGGVSRSERTTP